MAMPMLAGPGSIASVMLLVAQNNGFDRALVIFGALLLVLLISLGALLAAGPLMRLIGGKGEAIITRLLGVLLAALAARSEEHTSELQSLMRISYAVFCLKKKNHK